MYLSFFWFRAIYGRFCGLTGRASSFALFLSRCGSGRGGFPSLLLFGRVVAPKEHSRSGSVVIRTHAAQMIVNVVFVAEWARAGYGRENLSGHYSTNSKWKFLWCGKIPRQHLAICEKSNPICRPASLQEEKISPVSIQRTGFPREIALRIIPPP